MDAHPELVAPCGMNCSVCSRYLKGQHGQEPGCPGCQPRNRGCTYRTGLCDRLRIQATRFCYQCTDFPCGRLEKLDVRYRKRYHVSLIDNLQRIRQGGIQRFLCEERERWRCPACGGTMSIHMGRCIACGYSKQ